MDFIPIQFKPSGVSLPLFNTNLLALHGALKKKKIKHELHPKSWTQEPTERVQFLNDKIE